MLRQITRVLPLPGRVVRRILDYYDENKSITYPSEPTIVPARGGFGLFEISNYSEYSQRCIYFLGYYELRETIFIKRYLRPGDVFIDVGANIGWFTLFAANIVGLNGKVIAFEPSSKIWNHLKRNIEINSVRNVKIEKLALSNKNGAATLSGIIDKHWGLGTIIRKSENSDNVAEEVQTIRFDDYVRDNGLNIENIRFIKIDVEGAEIMVLQGMKDILERKVCDYLIVEVCDSRLRETGSSSAEVLALLRSYGYRLFRIGVFRIKPLGDDEKVSIANILAKATR